MLGARRIRGLRSSHQPRRQSHPWSCATCGEHGRARFHSGSEEAVGREDDALQLPSWCIWDVYGIHAQVNVHLGHALAGQMGHALAGPMVQDG